MGDLLDCRVSKDRYSIVIVVRVVVVESREMKEIETNEVER